MKPGESVWRQAFIGRTLEAGNNDSDYKLNSYLATAFAQFQQNRWWADAA